MKFKALKKIIYILIGLVLPLLSFGSDQPDALFAKGNAFYAKGDYKDALSAYQQVLNQGYQSSALYYNMGNASYRNGDIAPTLLYYEKAHKLAPHDEDISVNIRFANLKTADKIDETPEYFLTQWWKTFLLSVSVQTLAVWSVLAILAAAGIFILYLFAGSILLKKAAFFLAICLLLFGLFTIFWSGQESAYLKSQRQAIVFSSIINVKNGPAEKTNTLFILHEGAKVNVLKADKGWIRIKLLNGTQGWIRQSDVKDI